MTDLVPPPAAEAGVAHVMETHLRALNSGDEALLLSTLHFPHYRLTGSTMTIWDGPDEYFADFRKRAGGDWGHSNWAEITLLHGNEEKVHVHVTVERFTTAGSLMARFETVWVITYIDGRWGAQFRTSFAPR